MNVNLTVKGTQATINGKTYSIAIGRSGYLLQTEKVEGDGGTPIGTFALRQLYYRADRIALPKTALKVIPLQRNDGWCDDPHSPDYNTHITLPFKGSHEELWREDSVYDIILVIGYNDSPPIPGKGSAIFIHNAREGYTPTAGCIAFNRSDLLEVLSSLTLTSTIQIIGD